MSPNSEVGRDRTSEKQYEALEQGKTDSRQITRISGMKNDVREKLLGAGTIFTEKDRQRWLAQLESAKDDSPDEIDRISRQIDEEKNEIQAKTSEFIASVNKDRQYFGFNNKKKISESEQWIEAFKKQPLETKREWLKGLEEKIGELKTLFETASGLERTNRISPADMENFASLSRGEKKKFLEEIQEYNRKADEFNVMLEKTRDFYSPQEMETIKADFRDLAPKEQDEFIKNLNGKDLEERKKINEQFASYPEAYTAKRSDFNLHSPVEKKLTLRNMENEFQRDYAEELFRGEFSGYMSHDSQQKAFEWFINAPMDVRKMAIKVLKKQMEQEAKKCGEYKKLLEDNKNLHSEDERKLLIADFKRLTYEEKEKTLSELKEKISSGGAETREKEHDLEKYGKLMGPLLADKIISRETFDRRMEKFGTMAPAERNAVLKPENFQRYKKARLDLLNQFEKLPPKLRTNTGFYQESFADRVKTYEAVKQMADLDNQKAESEADNDNKDLSPEQQKQITSLKLQAAMQELNRDLKGALKTYDAILIINPQDKQAKERTPLIREKLAADANDNQDKKDDNLRKSVKETLQSADIKKERIDNKLLNTFAQATDLNDRHNATGIKSAEKEKHLTAEEKQIQKGLFKRSGMVLDANGRAAKVMKVDLNAFKDQNDGDKEAMKKTLRDKTEDRNIRFLNNNFQVTREGEIISGSRAMEELAKNEQKLKSVVKDRIIAGLKARDKELTGPEKSLLEKLIAEQDLMQDLSN